MTRLGALRIDHAARDVRVGDTPAVLSAKEYALLAYLAADPARVFTKHDSCETCGGSARPDAREPSTMPAGHKLSDAGDGRWIECLRGVGYRLAPLDQQRSQARAA